MIKHKGFTIVELLIVIVVIAVLAAISIVAYNGIQSRAAETILKSDLTNAARQLKLLSVDNGTYPGIDDEITDGDFITRSEGTSIEYSRSNAGTEYCITAASTRTNVSAHYISSSIGTPLRGVCPNHSGFNSGINAALKLQSVTAANCPVQRSLSYDARDGHTYWVQKLPDGRCWMLTNLAYGGGGNNSHADAKSITFTDSETSSTLPLYYTHLNASPTTLPTEPSVSVDGGNSNPQYGYFYNWCAAMGAQTSTSACGKSSTSDLSVSICPSGWSLPPLSSFTSLNSVVGKSGLFSSWLVQLGGMHSTSGFIHQGIGHYWTSSPNGSGNAMRYSVTSSGGSQNWNTAQWGFAVRCVAS